MTYMCRRGPSSRVTGDSLPEGEFGMLTDTGEILIKHDGMLKCLTGEAQFATTAVDGEIALGAASTLVAWRGKFYLFKFTAFLKHHPRAPRFVAVLNPDYTYTPFDV